MLEDSRIFLKRFPAPSFMKPKNRCAWWLVDWRAEETPLLLLLLSVEVSAASPEGEERWEERGGGERWEGDRMGEKRERGEGERKDGERKKGGRREKGWGEEEGRKERAKKEEREVRDRNGRGKKSENIHFLLNYRTCIHPHTHTHHHSGQLPPGEAQTRETHKDM